LRAADYERFTGSKVKLKTRNPINGNQHFEGRLSKFHDGRLTLEMGASRKKARPHDPAPQTLEIELANVEQANLVPEI
jgi:ribosome maturation factor RimP